MAEADKKRFDRENAVTVNGAGIGASANRPSHKKIAHQTSSNLQSLTIRSVYLRNAEALPW